ncbi:suppressor of cytokine signaling 2 isoform 3-T3 [Thomomys bottae]
MGFCRVPEFLGTLRLLDTQNGNSSVRRAVLLFEFFVLFCFLFAGDKWDLISPPVDPQLCLCRRSVGDHLGERLCRRPTGTWGGRTGSPSVPSPSVTIADTAQERVRGIPVTSRKDTTTCLCGGDPSLMTLRCLESSGNGANRTRSQWGTAGSAEEPCPEAARLAKALRELSHTGWYWGSMTVNEAKEKLKEAPEGTFLIRDSSHSDYLLTISVKTSAGPTNLRIEYQEGKFRLDSIICVKSKLKQFDSVVHLIDYYVQMCKDKRTGPEAPRNGTVHLYLTKPLYTSAPSLQHLCRLTINKCTGTIWGLPLPTRLKDYLEEYKFQ